MKSLYNKSYFLFITFFAIGVLYSGYTLYNMPTALEKVSGRIDLNIINEAEPVLNNAYLVIGLTLLMGVVLLVQFLHFLNSTKVADIQGIADVNSNQDTGQELHTEATGKDESSKVAQELLASVKNIKSKNEKYEKILSKVCMKMEASQGILYEVKKDKNKRFIEMLTSFAFSMPESETLTYEFGEGLAGQVAKEGKKINIDNIPEGYVNIISGLGSASPNHLLIYPISSDKEVIAIAEIASFKEITAEDEKLIAEVLKMEVEKPNATKVESSSTTKKKGGARVGEVKKKAEAKGETKKK